MIHWKEFGLGYDDAFRQRWRDYYCGFASWCGGECMGYDRAGDDEPCDICKACDRHSGWEEREWPTYHGDGAGRRGR